MNILCIVCAGKEENKYPCENKESVDTNHHVIDILSGVCFFRGTRARGAGGGRGGDRCWCDK